MPAGLRCQSAAGPTCAWVVVVVLSLAIPSYSQQLPAAALERDWQALVREKVHHHELGAAMAVVQEQLAETPGDLEAHGWRARLLAWQGQWGEAESQYHYVLDHAPNDTDILCGLSDVLLWQGKLDEALEVIDRARPLAPGNAEVLLRRARILRGLGQVREARQQYQDVLNIEPDSREAKAGLAGAAPERKHELRIGGDASTFNYTDPAEAQSVLVSSRWAARWSTAFGVNFYQRFGEDATKITSSGSFRFARKDWLTASAAIGHTNGAIPKREASFEYGHGLHVSNVWIKGLDISYRQHWLWYDGARVLALTLTQFLYLPRECTWSLAITGARGGFAGAGVEWVPSGSTRLEFPLHPKLSASLSFANGTENFAHIDQLGRFSARTFGGGLRYRFTVRHDVSGYIAVQKRSQDRTENSYGLSYGYRF